MNRSPVSRLTAVLIAFVWASCTLGAEAGALQEQRLFWARFAIDAEVTELVLHGAGREAWTTSWRPAPGELGAAQHWLPIALGSDFELQMGEPVRADDGPGEARFLEWAPALPEFARSVPLEIWSRALPQDAAVARRWSLSAGLGLTAAGLALLALAGLRRAPVTSAQRAAPVDARRAAFSAALLGGATAVFAALRMEGSPALQPWTVYELGGPEGGRVPPASESEPRGLKQTFARDFLEWSVPTGEPDPPALVLRTDPPGAPLRLTAVGDSGWRAESKGHGLALAETDGLLPLGRPAQGSHPFSRDLWGVFADELQGLRSTGTLDPSGLEAVDGPCWAYWGGESSRLGPARGPFPLPGWLLGGLPSGREVLIIHDPRQRIALRWFGLDG